MSRSSVFSLSLFRDVAAFGAVIAQIGGRRTWTALLFLILGSLTEGISILLLVPLLHLVERVSTFFHASHGGGPGRSRRERRWRPTTRA